MTTREKMAALAGIFSGVALALIAVDGLILYAVQIHAPPASLLRGEGLAQMVAGIATIGSLCISAFVLRRTSPPK